LQRSAGRRKIKIFVLAIFPRHLNRSGDRLLAIGLRGDFEGWVGYVNPTTEIWFADR
jgi:hypothetical protein